MRKPWPWLFPAAVTVSILDLFFAAIMGWEYWLVARDSWQEHGMLGAYNTVGTFYINGGWYFSAYSYFSWLPLLISVLYWIVLWRKGKYPSDIWDQIQVTTHGTEILVSEIRKPRVQYLIGFVIPAAVVVFLMNCMELYVMLIAGWTHLPIYMLAAGLTFLPVVILLFAIQAAQKTRIPLILSGALILLALVCTMNPAPDYGTMAFGQWITEQANSGQVDMRLLMDRATTSIVGGIVLTLLLLPALHRMGWFDWITTFGALGLQFLMLFAAVILSNSSSNDPIYSVVFVRNTMGIQLLGLILLGLCVWRGRGDRLLRTLLNNPSGSVASRPVVTRAA